MQGSPGKSLIPGSALGMRACLDFTRIGCLPLNPLGKGALPLTVISSAQIKNSCSQVFSPSLNTWWCHTNGRCQQMQLSPVWGAGTSRLKDVDWTERDFELLTSASVCAWMHHGAFMNRQRGQPSCYISAGIPAICDWIERMLEFQKLLKLEGVFILHSLNPQEKLLSAETVERSLNKCVSDM